MESRVERHETKHGCFEVGTITHEGHEFSAIGAYKEIVDGRAEYGLYLTGSGLTTWAGHTMDPAPRILNRWQSNFGDKRVHIEAVIEGARCRGILYNEDWNQFVRLRECQ